MAHQHPSAVVYLHLDNHYIGEISDLHQMQISPGKGKHKITVVDETGNALAMDFEVE